MRRLTDDQLAELAAWATSNEQRAIGELVTAALAEIREQRHIDRTLASQRQRNVRYAGMPRRGRR